MMILICINWNVELCNIFFLSFLMIVFNLTLILVRSMTAVTDPPRYLSEEKS